MSLSIAATVFGLIFAGELPDKTAIATLVMGARYSAPPVLAGVWAAFTVHVVVACAAGRVITLLPHRLIELVASGLFLFGATILLRSDQQEIEASATEEVAEITAAHTRRRVIVTAFTVILVAEFGDLTQILIATLTAKYQAPLSVGVGSLLALWSVAAIAVAAGRSLLRVVPLRRVQQVAAIALVTLAVYSIVAAARG